MTSRLSEIIIKDTRIRIRKRNDDMADWLCGIRSVLFPVSICCEALIGGKWKECILTGKLADDGSGKLLLTVTFSDATQIMATGSRNSFLPDEKSVTTGRISLKTA